MHVMVSHWPCIPASMLQTAVCQALTYALVSQQACLAGRAAVAMRWLGDQPREIADASLDSLFTNAQPCTTTGPIRGCPRVQRLLHMSNDSCGKMHTACAELPAAGHGIHTICAKQRSKC